MRNAYENETHFKTWTEINSDLNKFNFINIKYENI